MSNFGVDHNDRHQDDVSDNPNLEIRDSVGISMTLSRELELTLSMLCRRCGRKMLLVSEKLECQMTGGLCRDCARSMRVDSKQWLAELDRQAVVHGLDGWLWLMHFGDRGILPEDENAICANCNDRFMDLCWRSDRRPLECMKPSVSHREMID